MGEKDDGEKVLRRVDWQNNHDLIQSAYIDLLYENKRIPSMTQVAARCNLSRNAVYEHCRELDLEDFVPSAKLHTQAVLNGIIAAGSQGDAACAKLFFQLVWKFKEKIGVEGEVTVYDGLQFISFQKNGEERVERLESRKN